MSPRSSRKTKPSSGHLQVASRRGTIYRAPASPEGVPSTAAPHLGKTVPLRGRCQQVRRAPDPSLRPANQANKPPIFHLTHHTGSYILSAEFFRRPNISSPHFDN